MAIKKKTKKAAGKMKKAVTSAARKVKAAAKGGSSGPSPKQIFLETAAREHATTLRVLRAFPPGSDDFRPHPRSQSLSDLAYTMLFEQELNNRALNGGPIMGAGAPPSKPASLQAAIDQFDRGYRALVERITRTPDAKMNAMIQFPKGPGQMGEYPVMGFLWFMLFDQIHHRGQLSVMLRMAGGKVPSIYGPSGDEPWTLPSAG